MTTFTLQDLTPVQQEAVKQHEAMHAAHQVLNTRSINNLPTTPEEDEAMKELFEKMGQDLANHELAHQQAQQARLDAVPPQPTTQVSPEAVIDEMLYTIKQSLLLLATLINQPQPQPEAGTNVPSLQETIELTLQQADWFKDMVKDEVESRVESEVEMYFERRFDPTDHFDFGDAVSNEVDDRLDDVVRDRIDEAVEEQLGEVVAERLKNIRVVFD
jgi:hypothetical protein